MADQRPRAGARGDEAELFRAFNPELMRDIAHALYGTSPDVVEDACSFAWSQFLLHQPDRDRNWQGWLFRTAQREGWRIAREGREAQPLRTSDEERLTEFVDVADPRDPHAINERVNDAFSILEQLPPRLQRIAMLRALGLRHNEIGELTGDSKTKVGQLVGASEPRDLRDPGRARPSRARVRRRARSVCGSSSTSSRNGSSTSSDASPVALASRSRTQRACARGAGPPLHLTTSASWPVRAGSEKPSRLGHESLS